MKILLINGSIAKESHTRVLINTISEKLKTRHFSSEVWDLKEEPLPIAIPEFHRNPWTSPSKLVQEFVQSVINAEGIILGTPLYHGSFSGVLKNALDNLHFDAFRDKPIGLVSHGSNVRLCASPCDQLRPVVRALYGYALHTQIGTTQSDYENYKLVNKEIFDRIDLMIEEFIRFDIHFHSDETHSTR